MGLTGAEIAAVLKEIGPAVTGGWLQKVFQPAPRVLLLEVRARGRTLLLLCSADPATARVHLASRRLPNPASPPPFCQFLRAHVQGARIDRVEQMGGDRIVRLRLTGHEGPCSLIVAMTGRTADLLVLDAGDRIMASLDGQGLRGRAYLPQLRDLPEPASGEPPRPEQGTDQPFPLSFELETRYHRQEAESIRSAVERQRLAALRRSLKRLSRRREALQQDLEKATRYRDYGRYGELLKANLGHLKKGFEQVTVVDYFDPALPELTLPLDPSKGLQANMDDYFKKHRKFLAAEQEIRPRLTETGREIERLRAEQQALEAGTWQPPATQPAPARRQPASARPPAAGPPGRSGPYRRFTSSDGLPIYVGRNAKENDELTFKFAQSDDLWLHARGMPGSHVVVRLPKGADTPPETLRDAATLALQYSDLKKSGKGEVIYTRRKWVKKLKGQPPGTVAVTQEKTVFVQLDRARLERLKHSTAPGS